MKRQILKLLIIAAIVTSCDDKDIDPVVPSTKDVTIKGKVTNSTDDSAISGATITTEPASSTATSASDGTYTINNVADGSYKIKASATGYRDYVSSSISLSSGAGSITSTQDIKMTVDDGSTSGGDDKIVFPIDFESTSIDYAVTSFSSASGGDDTTTTASIVDNPASGGINTSVKVAKIIEASGSTWGGAHLTLFDPIDLSTKKGIAVKVYSTKAEEKLTIKLENKDDNKITHEATATVTAANTWEELIFNFSTVDTSIDYQKITFVYERLDGTTYYLDDIKLIDVTTLTKATLPMTFDTTANDYSGWAGFDGGIYALSDNPSASGANMTAKVAKYTKGGATVYAGMFYTFDSGIDFSTNKAIKMKVYSPTAGGKVLLKVENSGDGNIFKEKEMTITAANTWEEIEFYLDPDTTQTYDKLVVIFDNGTAGNDTVYYFDEIESLVGTPPSNTDNGLRLPLTFEDDSLNYNLLAFNGAGAEITDNPSKTGINTSNKTLKITHGADPSGGVTVLLGDDIDHSTKTVINVKVYSPTAGTVIRLKVESGTDVNVYSELDISTTVADAWETLSFDISKGVTYNIAHAYSKVNIFPNFGTAGSGEIYYFDDIEQVNGGETTTPGVPTTASAAPTTAAASVINLFSETYPSASAATQIAVDNWNPGWGQQTIYSEETIAGNLVKKYANLDYQGIEIQRVDISSKTKVHLDLWTNDINEFRLKLVSADDQTGTNKKEIEVIVSSSLTKNSWTGYDVDLSTFTGIDLTGIFQIVISGDGIDTKTVYVDNVYFY